jgi:cupin 2 domain-containing protein
LAGGKRRLKNMKVKNFFQDIPRTVPVEIFEPVASAKGFKIERIISRGQSTPSGVWLSEKKREWVMVLKGRAKMRFFGRIKIVEMGSGDYLCIPAGIRHRVEWTDDKGPTVWLAIHF